MIIRCPETGKVIPSEHINVDTDVALSPFTGEAHRLSELLRRQTDQVEAHEELATPPEGAWKCQEKRGLIIGASARQLSTGFFLVIFSLTMVAACVYVLGQLGETQPSLTEQLQDLTDDDSEDAPSMFIFLLFLFGAFASFFTGLYFLFGKEELVIGPRGSRVFFGIGLIGWSRPVKTTGITSVEVKTTGAEVNERPVRKITVVSDEPFSFGWTISKDRKRFVVLALRSLIESEEAAASDRD